MASSPTACGSNLNPNAEPWSPFTASHQPSPSCSQTLQMLPLHASAFQFPFSHPHPHANFSSVYLSVFHQPRLFPPHTATNMQFPPLIETYNMGHQEELVDEAVSVVVTEENGGGPQRRSRNRGFGRRKASGGDRFVRGGHRNQAHTESRPRIANRKVGADRKRSHKNPSSNECRKGVQSRASRRLTEDTTPLESGGEKTTVMIRNIPNEYTREMLKDFLIEHCKMENNGKEEEKVQSAFDFLYLPIDFGTQLNKGYAFVNFTNPEAARRFSLAKNNQRWDFFKSNKIRHLCCAVIQGKEKLVMRFEGMSFPRKEYEPLCFEPAHDGSGQMVKEISIGMFTNHQR